MRGFDSSFFHRFHSKSSDSGEGACALCLQAIPMNAQSKVCEKCFRKHSFNQKYFSFGAEKGDESRLPRPMSHENPLERSCNLCKKVLGNARMLGEHLIEHSFRGCSERGFTCYICSTVFTSASGLHQHMDEHGPNARPYDCTLCTEKFFFRTELDNHLIDHESGYAPARVATPTNHELNGAMKKVTDAERAPSDESDEKLQVKIETQPDISDSHSVGEDEYIEIEKIAEQPMDDNDEADPHAEGFKEEATDCGYENNGSDTD